MAILGSAENPILISNATQFKAIDNNPSAHYKLTANIIDFANANRPLQTFTGVLDGNGFRIARATTTNWMSASMSLIFGGHINGGTVKNLFFDFGNINMGTATWGYQSGGLALRILNAKIINCHAIGGKRHDTNTGQTSSAFGAFTYLSEHSTYIGCTLSRDVDLAPIAGSLSAGFTVFGTGLTFENCGSYAQGPTTFVSGSLTRGSSFVGSTSASHVFRNCYGKDGLYGAVSAGMTIEDCYVENYGNSVDRDGLSLRTLLTLTKPSKSSFPVGWDFENRWYIAKYSDGRYLPKPRQLTVDESTMNVKVYEIHSRADLQAMNDSRGYYKLMDNIDLEHETYASPFNMSLPFEGVFDGQNFTINNLRSLNTNGVLINTVLNALIKDMAISNVLQEPNESGTLFLGSGVLTSSTHGATTYKNIGISGRIEAARLISPFSNGVLGSVDHGRVTTGGGANVEFINCYSVVETLSGHTTTGMVRSRQAEGFDVSFHNCYVGSKFINNGDGPSTYTNVFAFIGNETTSTANLTFDNCYIDKDNLADGVQISSSITQLSTSSMKNNTGFLGDAYVYEPNVYPYLLNQENLNQGTVPSYTEGYNSLELTELILQTGLKDMSINARITDTSSNNMDISTRVVGEDTSIKSILETVTASDSQSIDILETIIASELMSIDIRALIQAQEATGLSLEALIQAEGTNTLDIREAIHEGQTGAYLDITETIESLKGLLDLIETVKGSDSRSLALNQLVKAMDESSLGILETIKDTSEALIDLRERVVFQEDIRAEITERVVGVGSYIANMLGKVVDGSEVSLLLTELIESNENTEILSIIQRVIAEDVASLIITDRVIKNDLTAKEIIERILAGDRMPLHINEKVLGSNKESLSITSKIIDTGLHTIEVLGRIIDADKKTIGITERSVIQLSGILTITENIDRIVYPGSLVLAISEMIVEGHYESTHIPMIERITYNGMDAMTDLTLYPEISDLEHIIRHRRGGTRPIRIY